MGKKRIEVIAIKIPRFIYDAASAVSDQENGLRTTREILWAALNRGLNMPTPSAVKTLPITDHFKKVAPAPVSTVPEHLKEKFRMPSNYVRPEDRTVDDPMPPAVAGEPKFEAWLERKRARENQNATYPKGHSQNPYTYEEFQILVESGNPPVGELSRHLNEGEVFEEVSLHKDYRPEIYDPSGDLTENF